MGIKKYLNEKNLRKAKLIGATAVVLTAGALAGDYKSIHQQNNNYNGQLISEEVKLNQDILDSIKNFEKTRKNETANFEKCQHNYVEKTLSSSEINPVVIEKCLQDIMGEDYAENVKYFSLYGKKLIKGDIIKEQANLNIILKQCEDCGYVNGAKITINMNPEKYGSMRIVYPYAHYYNLALKYDGKSNSDFVNVGQNILNTTSTPVPHPTPAPTEEMER